MEDRLPPDLDADVDSPEADVGAVVHDGDRMAVVHQAKGTNPDGGSGFESRVADMPIPKTGSVARPKVTNGGWRAGHKLRVMPRDVRLIQDDVVVRRSPNAE